MRGEQNREQRCHHDPGLKTREGLFLSFKVQFWVNVKGLGFLKDVVKIG